MELAGLLHLAGLARQSTSGGVMMATPFAFATPRSTGDPLALSSPNAL